MPAQFAFIHSTTCGLMILGHAVCRCTCMTINSMSTLVLVKLTACTYAVACVLFVDSVGALVPARLIINVHSTVCVWLLTVWIHSCSHS